MPSPHILIAVGARPNFMKAAPLLSALRSTRRVRLTLVHTGQHYDPELYRFFLKDLRLPKPSVDLRSGPGSHAAQTALILRRLEAVLLRLRPDAVVVVGDVNSTAASALAAWKVSYPRGTPANPRRMRPLLAHVEAGLRSFDRSMPEEANRIVTDHLSDLLFAPSEDAVRNLRREGISDNRISFPGNVMIDSLRQALSRARKSNVLRRLGIRSSRFGLVTLHRPANVDIPSAAGRIVRALETVASQIPLVFPMHPRTRRALARAGLLRNFASNQRITLTPPLGYLDFLKLMASARLVLTDSGGIQEEATVLGVPCLTLRESTERPITVSLGTNRLVGTDPARIVAACDAILRRSDSPRKIPPRWDGRAARRIARILLRRLSAR